MNTFDPDKKNLVKPGFSTPPDYFDGLEDRVFAKLESQETKVIPLFTRYKSVICAAAAILVLALLIPIYNNIMKPTEDVDDAALENYLAYQSGINQFDLLTVLEPEDIEKIEVELPVEDEAIEAFLSTNEIEHIITD